MVNVIDFINEVIRRFWSFNRRYRTTTRPAPGLELSKYPVPQSHEAEG